MYKIDRNEVGYILTFSGSINGEEMVQWYDNSKRFLSEEIKSTFGVIINMEDLKLLTSETRTIMINGQKLYKDKGMVRSSVILNSTEITIQFKNLAMVSGIFSNERYIDSSQIDNPMKASEDWVYNEIDPYK
jgi:hypothetical protein